MRNSETGETGSQEAQSRVAVHGRRIPRQLMQKANANSLH